VISSAVMRWRVGRDVAGVVGMDVDAGVAVVAW
jgi:hypothetical protein